MSYKSIIFTVEQLVCEHRESFLDMFIGDSATSTLSIMRAHFGMFIGEWTSYVKHHESPLDMHILLHYVSQTIYITVPFFNGESCS